MSNTKEAANLGKKGEGGDTLVGHLSKGDTVIPIQVFQAEPALAQAVHDAFIKAGADPLSYVVGSPKQNINTKTGIPEFGWWKSIRNFGEKAVGAAAGFAVGGPAGAAIGSGLVGAAQGDRGLALVGDAAGGYFGGGTAYNVGSGLVNSGVGAVTGTAGAYGSGDTIGSLVSGAGKAISNVGTSAKNLVSGAGNFLSGNGSDITAAGTYTGGAGANGLLTNGAAAGAGGGTTATAGYGANILSKLNNAPSWLAPVASLSSGALQYSGTQDAIKAEQEAQAKQQGILKPYVDAGNTALTQESNLVNDPQAQADFVKNNPLYSNLAEDATRRLTATQAANGKLKSGGTAKALQDQLLNLGTNLVNNQVTNLHNITTTGANAAAGVGSGAIQTGNNVAEYSQDAGTNLGAGVVGASNGVTSNYQNQINTLLALQRLQNPNIQTYQPNSFHI